MSSGRLELKVGLFAIVLLGLAAVMAIKFSKTGFGLGETYSFNLHAENAGTVIKDSPVLMSGVKVGYVDSIDLLKDQNGAAVVELGIRLFTEYEGKILDQNSTFFIKSSGFLGDQYIGITPHRGPPIRKKLEKQGWLECKKPFDIEETGQSIGEFIKKVDSAVETIDGFVKKIDQGLLSDEAVTNLTETIANFRETSKSVKEKFDDNGSVSRGIENFNRGMTHFNVFSTELRDEWRAAAPGVHQSVTNLAVITTRLRVSADKLDEYISSKQPEVDQALKNIAAFSEKLDKTTADLQSTLANNRTNITKVIENISAATENIKGISKNADKIVERLESGKGFVGGLLKDEEMRVQFQSLISNLNTTAKGLTNIVKEINAHGLFYKPKPEKTIIPRTTRPR
jgi:phospholipid/cholesterol/gamma-HCH transport system substrate-binding protein